MILKPGVRIAGLKPEMLFALIVVEREYSKRGAELMVTSAVEGKHSAGSLHYVGYALDFRTSDSKLGDLAAMVNTLKLQLGLDFDVVLEVDHLHVEFQPKTGVNL